MKNEKGLKTSDNTKAESPKKETGQNVIKIAG
jgi:hypothetical protein